MYHIERNIHRANFHASFDGRYAGPLSQRAAKIEAAAGVRIASQVWLSHRAARVRTAQLRGLENLPVKP
jgi:hypothetical protein